MKLVRLKPVLRPLFPYEFEIPAGPSGTPWFRWALSNRVLSSCPVRRIPRQDPLHTIGWESLTNGWYTIIPKDKVKAESLLITEHSSHTSMCMNNVSLFCCLPIHQLVAKFSSYFIEIEWWHSFHYISATLHLTIFGIWSNNIQSVQYVICVMIVRGLWNIGLAIRYIIWIVAHLCTSRGTFLRINGKTTLSPLDATAARRWRCSSCQFLTLVLTAFIILFFFLQNSGLGHF